MSELCPLTYHTVIPVPVIISGVASRGPAGFQIGLHLITMMLGLSALTSSRPVIYHCGGGNKSAASLALLIGCVRSSETPAAMLSFSYTSADPSVEVGKRLNDVSAPVLCL